jgi:hypothetical protein
MLLAVSVAAISTTASANEWEQIGSKKVDFAELRDTIRVTGKKRHRRLRLCVERRAVSMRDFDVVFANGSRQDIRIRRLIRPGTCTRAVDLVGKSRDIARIILKYDPTPRDKPAVVKIFAR